MPDKILFLQQHPFPYFGVMSISSYLKKNNYSTDLLIASLEKNLIKKLYKINPYAVAISAMSIDHNWIIKTAGRIKQINKNLPVVLGGIYTFCNPDIIKNPDIDYAVIGEGEHVMNSLLPDIHSPGKIDIPGVITKYNFGKTNLNKSLSLEYLNELPFEDRKIYYDRYAYLKKLSNKQVISSRGCYYSCSFCVHSEYRKIFKNPANYVRYKSPEYFISETEKLVEEYPAKSLFFADDMFGANTEWLENFVPLYTDSINKPFMVISHVNLLNEKTISLLKSAGCYCVSIGVETGVEKNRFEIFNKKISNKQISDCANLLKKYNIKLQTSNIFAYPSETPRDAFKTIHFNREIGTDYMFSTLLMPFPKTKITELAQNMKILDNNFSLAEFPLSFQYKSVLNQDNFQIIENIHKISFICLKFPKLEPFFKWLAFNKFNFLCFLIFALTYFLRYMKERRTSFCDAVKLFWRFRKSYF